MALVHSAQAPTPLGLPLLKQERTARHAAVKVNLMLYKMLPAITKPLEMLFSRLGVSTGLPIQ